MLSQRPRMTRGSLAIAVDFGTTYTGVAYRVLTGMESLHGPAAIAVQIPWTGPSGLSYKVPSVVSYDAQSSALVSYGYSTKGHPADPTRTHRKMRNFKLRLFLPEDPNYDPSASTNERSPRTPEQAVVDFLGQVYIHVLNVLQDRGFGPENAEYNVLFTVPATYKPHHVENFRELVRQTAWGMHKVDINLMEPEAAARHTIQHTMRTVFGVEESFVLCDAGGGTVDLASYKIKAIEPRLELEQTEVVDGTADGSTRIDRRFSEYLLSCIGPEQARQVSPKQKNEMMEKFIKKKELFEDEPTQPYYNIKLCPESLEGADIFNGRLRISRNKMQELFQPSIKSILNLINGHVESCEMKGIRVSSIFLVGGLGSSPYVLKCIKSYASNIGIQVIQPAEAEYAVILGATATQFSRLQGEPDPVKLYLCPAHYGVLCNTPWNPNRHRDDIDGSYINSFTGKRMATNQVAWLIKKGDRIIGNRQKDLYQNFERSFKKTPDEVWSDFIVMSTLDHPPFRLGPGVMKLCSVESDMRKEREETFEKGDKYGEKKWYKRRKRCRRCKFHIVVKVGTADLEFVMRYKETVRSELMKVNWKGVGQGQDVNGGRVPNVFT